MLRSFNLLRPAFALSVREHCAFSNAHSPCDFTQTRASGVSDLHVLPSFCGDSGLAHVQMNTYAVSQQTQRRTAWLQRQ